MAATDMMDDKKKPTVEYIDRPLGRTIKVKDSEKKLISECKWLPLKPMLCAILGKSGAGKSETCLTIAPYLEKYLASVFVLTSILGNKAFAALSEWCDANDIEYVSTSDAFSAEDMLSELIEHRPEDKYTLVILDDFTDQYGRNSTKRNTVVTNIFTRARNYNCFQIMIAQGTTQLPPICRNNVNLYIVYMMTDESARSKFISSAMNMIPDTTFDIWEDLFDSLRGDEHSCFIVSVGNDYKTPQVWVSNPDSNMALQYTDMRCAFDASRDDTLQKILAGLDTLHKNQYRRQWRTYKEYLKKYYGEDAVNKTLRLYPQLE